MSKPPSSGVTSGGPLSTCQTKILNAEIVVDGKVLANRGHALLARYKLDPRPVPDDASATHEELTHLFVGDEAACLMVANAIEQTSDGEFFGPLCGRSGRNVTVITCANGANQVVVEAYGAIACDCKSKRDGSNVLQVSKVLLTTKVPSSWTDEFWCSYMANANGIDPTGGVEGGPKVPDARCKDCGSKGSPSAKGPDEDAGATS